LKPHDEDLAQIVSQMVRFNRQNESKISVDEDAPAEPANLPSLSVDKIVAVN
jgi:hypothetical protein